MFFFSRLEYNVFTLRMNALTVVKPALNTLRGYITYVIHELKK